MRKEILIGVKTSKIYSRPSCPAKTPLPKNIVHFKTAAQAEREGYRACKRCFPDFPVEKWDDTGTTGFLRLPKEFDFAKCLKFMARSPEEPCHLVNQGSLYKLLKLDQDPILLKIQLRNKNALSIEFLTKRPIRSIRAKVAKYIWNWFDMETNLKSFYRMAKDDVVLKHIATSYYGLRMVSIPDLFEAICWAIMGQHINLNFAYILKKRFVESFGERFRIDNRNLYLFPTPELIAKQTVSRFKQLQFTAKKSAYIIEVAKKIKEGALSKKILLEKGSFKSAKKELMRLHGVGKWTAEYVCLRCLKDPAAFPVDDVGLQNAIKRQLSLATKPTVDEIYKFSRPWKNWEAYATFYLWNSLL